MASALSESALITGSTDGIGVSTARNILTGNNAISNVLVHGRDGDRVRSAVASIQKYSDNESYTVRNKNNVAVPLPVADLSTVGGCYDLARSVLKECSGQKSRPPKSLKVLMNNAGVYSKDLVRTQDGLELTFAVNVLAPFVVTSMLLSTLLENGIKNDGNASRIVIASSISQSWKLSKDYWDDPQYRKRLYSAHNAYSESKLLDAMLTMEMAHRLHNMAGIDTSVIMCNCLDPGTVNTKMLLDGWGPIGMRVNDALDETWCCTSEELDGISGEYFVGQSSRRASGCAYDSFHRERLWKTLSELAPEAAAEWDRAIEMYSRK